MTNEGTVITTSYKRYNFSLNGSLQARDNLKFQLELLIQTRLRMVLH